MEALFAGTEDQSMSRARFRRSTSSARSTLLLRLPASDRLSEIECRELTLLPEFDGLSEIVCRELTLLPEFDGLSEIVCRELTLLPDLDGLSEIVCTELTLLPASDSLSEIECSVLVPLPVGARGNPRKRPPSIAVAMAARSESFKLLAIEPRSLKRVGRCPCDECRLPASDSATLTSERERRDFWLDDPECEDSGRCDDAMELAVDGGRCDDAMELMELAVDRLSNDRLSAEANDPALEVLGVRTLPAHCEYSFWL
ncbi:hypothetical protein [Trinickia sp.]|uniref:hypothetical protein n=1 Tax=Trinickia sp. TaxID=2571163 RepID=UPI003F7E9FA2